MVASATLSFTSYDVFTPPEFVGFENYERLLSSPDFWHSWRVTIIYAVASIIYTVFLAFAFAMLLFHARRARGFWRTLYYLPALLAGAAEALILSATWNRAGLVNAALQSIGIEGPGWIDAPDTALLALILARYWTIGNTMLLFLGGRASVPKELYEVAAVDGVPAWRAFRHVTLPLMTPILLFNLVIGIVFALQSFTQIFILTRGGPFEATNVIGLEIYFSAFRDLRMGEASALSWTLFLATFVSVIALFLSSKRWVHYEGDQDARNI